MPALTYEMITLNLRNPFRLSYGVSDTRQAFWIRLSDDEGWGEGTIPPYYHVDASEMTAFWARAALKTEPYPDDPDGIPAWVGLEGPAPARCAVELALYDRIARRRGLPLYQLLGLPKPRPRATSFTIAIDTPEAMAKMALQIRDYPIIKVKLGSEDDESRLAAIRAVRPDARLRVDANAGWTRDEAVRSVRDLEKFDLEMIEQPLVKNDIEGLGVIQSTTSIPIVADESVQTMEDVERLGNAGVQGINLKLMKVGGLTPALRIVHRASELGMKIMLGCMIETSIGTTAMAHLAGMAEWFDLDAPMLISNDPFQGIQYDAHANFSVPDRPGIGVIRADLPIQES
jgi:L-Ala-D/L-Glu epimerase